MIDLFKKSLSICPSGWKENLNTLLAPVVQKQESGIHWINLYPVDKYKGNQLHYTLDRDLSSGWRYPTFEQLGPGD